MSPQPEPDATRPGSGGGPAAPQPAVRVTDSTLRDGSHAVAHQFTPEQVRAIAAGLAAARVPVVEVSHGDGLGGSSFNYGFSATDEFQLLAVARAELPAGTKLAVLALPGIGTARQLRRAASLGVDVVRVATHCTEADIAPEHLGAAKSLGLETVGFLMMAHMIAPEELARQAKIMEDAGADCVYVVDSAGAMLPPQVADRVAALRAALRPETQVGVHAHNNLALAVGNSLAAIEAGAQQVDGCCRGLGAGAGNTPTEALVAALDRAEVAHGVDVFKLMDTAEEAVSGPLRGQLPELDRTSLLLGYAGLYSSFLLHSRRAAARFGVTEADLLLELGRRRVVGGQEDMIVDVAIELAGLTGAQ
jgi:4-hydroxy 2-oxovalerate aldolase